MSYFIELNDLMIRYGFRPDKKMAQFFINDENIVSKLVSLGELKESDVVLEIGAGTGFLTRELQKHCRVIAIELDDQLFELLEKELPKENIELLHENFLKCSLPEFNKIVCLPPYSISSDIIFKILDFEPELCVLVFQNEFVQKLCAQPGFQEFNATSVLAQYYFNVEFVQGISSEAFFPKPESGSAIVRLVSKKKFKELNQKGLFVKFIKNLFRFQNKNLRNALRHIYSFIKEDLPMDENGFNSIADKLSNGVEKVNLIEVEDFGKLYKTFFQTGQKEKTPLKGKKAFSKIKKTIAEIKKPVKKKASRKSK